MCKSALTSKVAFLSGVALCVAGAVLMPAQSARADDCLLDTNNNGSADSGTDTDLAADSGGADPSLACGAAAIASGIGATAVGASLRWSSIAP